MKLTHTYQFAAADESINGHEYFGSCLDARFLHMRDLVISEHGPLVEYDAKDAAH